MTVDDAKKLLLETIGYQILAARLDASVNRDAINRDIDAYGESVRADERERHEEMIIAFEGHGIAPDDVPDGYSYTADVVRKKLHAVRAEQAATIERLTKERESASPPADIGDEKRAAIYRRLRQDLEMVRGLTDDREEGKGFCALRPPESVRESDPRGDDRNGVRP